MRKLLLLLFSFLLTIYVFAQGVNTTLEFAHQQYQNKQFEEAILSYRRVLFFDQKQGQEVYKSLAYAYWEANQDWQKSIYYFDLAYQISHDEQEQYQIIFTKIQLYLLVHKYNDVQLELASLDDDELSHKLLLRKRFYQGIVTFQQHKYSESEQFLEVCLENDSLAIQQLSNAFLSFKKSKKRFRPKKIRNMSMIIPGLGQMYCGDWKAGINSLLLTTGLATIFVITAQGYTLLDATLTIIPWFQRYYSGGYKKAYKIAKHRIEDEKDKTYQEVIKIIRESKKNK